MQYGLLLESTFRQVKTFQRGPQEILRSADPELVRQRDHARDHGQAERATLFDGLIQRAETERS